MQHTLDAFFAHLSANGATPASTLSAYRADLTQCLAFLTDRGIIDIDAIQPADIQAFCAWLEAQKYATATIARRMVALRAFSTFLVAAGLLAADPCANLRSPAVTRSLRSAVTPEQIDALRTLMQQHTTAEGWRDRAMLEVLLSTALRASDLVALDIDDITLERAAVTAHGRRSRTLALSPLAVMTLASYLQIARPKLARTQTDEPALFLNHQGERLTRQGYWVVLKQHARQLGLEGITPEVLRQAVAAQRFAAGATTEEVQVLLGHAVRKTTAVYKLIPSIAP